MRGATPQSLAAMRGKDDPVSAAPPPSGANREVAALLEQNREKEAQLRVLQRSLEKTNTELRDLKLLVAIVAGSLLVPVVAGFGLALL